MKIGILSKNYAAQRLFLDKIKGAQYKDLRFFNWHLWKNAHLWFLRAIGKLGMAPEEAAARLFYDFRSAVPNSCDLYHFFNCISFDSKPWVLSVESAVPWPVSVTRCVESVDGDFSPIAHDEYVEKRLKVLAQSNCLALLTLSHCSENIQRALLQQFPLYEETIGKKLMTLHPAQELIVKDIAEKNLTWKEDEQFTFLYVGSNYYRKGGRESVQVLAELHKHYDFRLILISSMAVDEQCYMLTDHDEEDARQLIEENKDWIEYYPGLPNAYVIEKLKASHVCLLPTWMDTYAYSVLESQACGTPVITTDLRALSETNQDEVGWRIKVPVNRLNNPLNATDEQRQLFGEMLIKGLQKTIKHVLTHRLEVKEKAQKCLERIEKYHNPKNYVATLKQIYAGKVNTIQ